MQQERATPTMKDVAREAGVALGTVSKVFNHIPVGESYRLRVVEAAERLGYQVNSYARGMKAGRTHTVALILPDLVTPFFCHLAQEVCFALARRGCRMLLSVTTSDPDSEMSCIRMVQQNQVDGVIAITYNPALTVDGQLPFVSIDRYFNPSVPCVASDNFGGGQLAAERLIDLGCTRLLFLRTGSQVPGEADKRGDGFEAACRSRQVDYQALRLFDEEGGGVDPFTTYLHEHFSGGAPDFDGVFCCTDRLACQVQETLISLGLRVPEDVQIIGYDGSRRFGFDGWCCSTIVQPTALIAEQSVDLILREDRTTLPSLICLPVTYAAGGTTREPY